MHSCCQEDNSKLRGFDLPHSGDRFESKPLRSLNQFRNRTEGDPVSGTIEWAAVEGLLIAAGAWVIEGRGSRVRFEKDGEVETFHRPRVFGKNGDYTMTNTMTYKGYSARIDYDDEDGTFTGQIAGIRDGVGFHADNVEALREAFHEAVEDYIETCARIGKQPQKPYSGRMMFRVSPEVHRQAARAAELSGKSLNQWAEEVLDRAAR